MKIINGEIGGKRRGEAEEIISVAIEISQCNQK
jgi:hypothetical protein